MAGFLQRVYPGRVSTRVDPLYLPKSKSNVYSFLQGVSDRVLSAVPDKKLDSQQSSVFKLILEYNITFLSIEKTGRKP